LLIAAQIALALIFALAYALRAILLGRRGRRVPAHALACVVLGVVVLIAAIVALWTRGGELLYWRTAEHLLVGDLAGLLIAVGLTSAVIEPIASTPLRRLRSLRRPQIALALWAINLLVWQWPAIYDATLRHSSLAAVENVLLVALSVNMWATLVGDARPPRPLRSSGGKIAYLLTGRLLLAALACIAIWSPEVHYPYYLSRDTASSLSPLADQGIAGAIALGEAALLAIGLLLWMRAQLGRSPARRPSIATELLVNEEAGQSGAGALAMDVQA
jgi:cytochrome c oxidase assembly factor CtaG